MYFDNYGRRVLHTEEYLPEPGVSGIGSVAALWRYPVKSLLGEELEEGEFSGTGIYGDRAYAVADGESGQIRNAKRAGWHDLFSFAARLEGGATGSEAPSLRVSTPDGHIVAGEGPDRDRLLSEAFGRAVTLEEAGGDPFFDLGAVHLLTTASLERLRELYGEGDFDARRFRPNVVVELDSGENGFVEDGWVGRTLSLGEVVLEVTEPVARCVMTTLAQGDLPKDPKIMSTTYKYNDNRVGVYARVIRGGRVRRGDRVELT